MRYAACGSTLRGFPPADLGTFVLFHVCMLTSTLLEVQVGVGSCKSLERFKIVMVAEGGDGQVSVLG